MVCLINVIDDIKNSMFQNGNIEFIVQRRSNERWVVYVKIPYGQETAKLEFLIEDTDNEEEIEVIGSVLRYGSVSRSTIRMIMDSVLERL